MLSLKNQPLTRYLRSLTTSALAISIATSGLLADGYLRVMALEGALDLGLNQQIRYVDGGTMQEDGGFTVWLTGDDAGMFSAEAHFSPIRQILDRTEPSLDANGNMSELYGFGDFENKRLAAVRYYGSLQNGADDLAFMIHDGAAWTQLFRENDLHPTRDARFGSDINTGPFTYTFDGRIIIRHLLRANGLEDENDEVVIVKDGDEWTEIMREGETTFTDGKVWKNRLESTMLINREGDILLFGYLYDPENTEDSDLGLYILSEGTLTPVAVVGQAVPNGDGTIGNIEFQRSTAKPFPIAFSNQGDVAFVADVDGSQLGSADNQAIFLFRNGTLIEVARKSQLTPRGNGRISSIEHQEVSLNERGELIFEASFTGTRDGSNDNRGILRFNPTEGLSEIVRKGDLVFGGDDFVTPRSDLNLPLPADALTEGTVIFSFLVGGEKVFNDKGVMGFEALFASVEGSSAVSRTGFFAIHPDGKFVELIRTGAEVGGREIRLFEIRGSTGARGVSQSGFSNSGDALFTVGYGGGTSPTTAGVVVWIDANSSNRLVVTDQWEPNAGTFGWLNGTNTSAREAGWVYSVQLGWVYYPRFPWVYDSDWGWLYFTGRTGESGQYVSFYSPAHGALTITNESAVGWFFAWSSGKWDNFVTPIGNL